MKKKSGKRKIAKKKIARENYLYKSLMTIVIIGILVCIALLLILVIDKFFIEKEGPEELEGGFPSFGLGAFGTHVETGVYFPEDCSDIELMQTWNSVFENAPTNPTIVKHIVGERGGICESYLIYKVAEDGTTRIATDVDFLEILWDFPSSNKEITSIYTKLADGAITILNAITGNTLDNTMRSLVQGIDDGSYVGGSRSITSIDQAETEFNSVFKPTGGNWEEESRYSFEDRGQGFVSENVVLDLFLDSISTINLTFIDNFTDVNLTGSVEHPDILNLGENFANLGLSGEVDVTAIVRPSGGLVVYYDEEDSYSVGFNASRTGGGEFEVYFLLNHENWLNGASIPTNTFNVSVYGCYDGDLTNPNNTQGTTSNFSEFKTDSCLDSLTLEEYICDSNGLDIKNTLINCSLEGKICRSGVCQEEVFVNHPPIFLEACKNITWYNNTNKIMDLDNCFSDAEGDNLTFAHEYTGSGLNVTLTGADLILTPDLNWVGNGSIILNASDRENVTSGIMDFSVIETAPGIVPNGSEPPEPIPGDPIILFSDPSSPKINITEGKNMTFTITAANYTEIKWYLDSEFTGVTSRSYLFEGLKEGFYLLEAEVWNNNKKVSMSWNVFIEKPEKPKRSYLIYFIIAGIVVAFGVLLLILYLIKSHMDNEPFKKTKDSSIPLVTAPPREAEMFKLPEKPEKSKPLFTKPTTFPKPVSPIEPSKETKKEPSENQSTFF